MYGFVLCRRLAIGRGDGRGLTPCVFVEVPAAVVGQQFRQVRMVVIHGGSIIVRMMMDVWMMNACLYECVMDGSIRRGGCIYMWYESNVGMRALCVEPLAQR